MSEILSNIIKFGHFARLIFLVWFWVPTSAHAGVDLIEVCGEERISLDFKKVDLENFLQILGKQCGVRFVTSVTPGMHVSIRVVEVPKSYKLYPKVFVDYYNHVATYGQVYVIPTPAFFFGLIPLS